MYTITFHYKCYSLIYFNICGVILFCGSVTRWVNHCYPSVSLLSHKVFLSAICTSFCVSESCFSSRNPTPGILINRPNGSDVYKGVPKDYIGEVSASVHFYKRSTDFNIFQTIVWRGFSAESKLCGLMCLLLQDVTPENFLAVLKGDASKVKGGSGKVLKR